MDQDVVINRKATARYRGRRQELDGTWGHLYFVPNKNQADGPNSPPPHHSVPKPNQVKTEEKEETVEKQKVKGKRTEDKPRELEFDRSSKSDVSTEPEIYASQLQAALNKASGRYGPNAWDSMSIEDQITARDIELRILFGERIEAKDPALAHSHEKEAETSTQPEEAQIPTSSMAASAKGAAQKEAQDKAREAIRAKFEKLREEKIRGEAQAASQQVFPQASPQVPARTPKSSEPQLDDQSRVLLNNAASAQTSVYASSVSRCNHHSTEEVYVPPILTSHVIPEASSSRHTVNSRTARKCARNAMTPTAVPVSKCSTKSDSGSTSLPSRLAGTVCNQTVNPRQRSSVLISSIFDTVIVEPKDLSALRLLFDDMEREIHRRPRRLAACLKDCWDRWQPVLGPLLANMDEGLASELARLQDEIEVARKQRCNCSYAQQQYLKILVTVAYRYSVPAVHQVRNCGPQTKSLSEMEAEIFEGAEKATEHAMRWISAVSGSIRARQEAFIAFARAALDEDTVGTELEKELRREILIWVYRLQHNVQSRIGATRRVITKAHNAFRKQLVTDIHVSNVVQFLPSLLTAYTRSVGVLLDASINVRFGEIVQSFKSLYMRTVAIDPSKTYNEPHKFVRKWLRAHNLLLKALLLKDTFYIRAPSSEEVALAATSYEVFTASMIGDWATEREPHKDKDVDETCLTPQGTRPPSQNQEDKASPKSVPVTANRTTLKTKGADRESTPASSSPGQHNKARDKWFKRTVARMKKTFELVRYPSR